MMMSRNFNRRHSPNRRKTRVAAVMLVEGARYPVTIRDISYHGMLVEVPLHIALGTPISLCLLNQEIPAIVHRCEAGHIGIHLLERLDAETLLAIENADDALAAVR